MAGNFSIKIPYIKGEDSANEFDCIIKGNPKIYHFTTNLLGKVTASVKYKSDKTSVLIHFSISLNFSILISIGFMILKIL